MSEAKHLVSASSRKDPEYLMGVVSGDTACGITEGGAVMFRIEDVTCLRCRGTREFYILELEKKIAPDSLVSTAD